MNYAEYKAVTESTPLDIPLYREMLIDAASNGNDRLSQIVDVFVSLHVPGNYDADIQKIYSEGLKEIKENSYSEGLRDVADYASMVWAMPADLSESVFSTLDNMHEV